MTTMTIDKPAEAAAVERVRSQHGLTYQVLDQHDRYKSLERADKRNYVFKLAGEIEAVNLKQLVSVPDLAELAQPYFPKLLDLATLEQTPSADFSADDILYGNCSRDHDPKPPAQGLLLEVAGGLVSLKQVRSVYPQGLNPKDMAWIFRRLMMALGFAHSSGLLHLAINLENIWIQPEQHGLVLVEWEPAIKQGEILSAPINHHRQTVIAPELIEGCQPTTAADIYMAVSCMREIIAEPMPEKLRTFFNGCLFEQPSKRPYDAWEVKEEFDQLLEKLWGARKFRPFAVPQDLKRITPLDPEQIKTKRKEK